MRRSLPQIILLSAVLLMSAVALAQDGKEKPAAPCPDGMLRSQDTAGRCCWPNQAWSTLQNRCVGTPQCPRGYQAQDNSCVAPPCPAGQVRNQDTAGQCCWPGQVWSKTKEKCAGPPQCPQNFRPKDGGCISARQTPENMVWVPEGPFVRGSEHGYSDEAPVRTIYLDAFLMDIYEVSVIDYKACVDAGACSLPAVGSQYHNWGRPEREKHPITGVSWSQADAYCRWKGKRLPTEAEWEKAARGTQGDIFPWGRRVPSCELAIMNEKGRGCGVDHTWEVGSRPEGKSIYGIHDMAGNVWEWTADWYSPTAYEEAEERNPKGPKKGTLRVHRGGAWFNTAASLRSAMRNAEPPENTGFLGFRCAR